MSRRRQLSPERQPIDDGMVSSSWPPMEDSSMIAPWRVRNLPPSPAAKALNVLGVDPTLDKASRRLGVDTAQVQAVSGQVAVEQLASERQVRRNEDFGSKARVCVCWRRAVCN